MNIRLPNITGQTPPEQIRQLREYLFQLVGDLNYGLSTVENRVTQMQSPSAPTPAAKEKQAQDHFEAIKGLIIKSADVVKSFYEKIDNLLKLNGEYVASSDFGTFKEQTQMLINAASDSLQSVISKIEQIENGMEDIQASQTSFRQTAEEIKITVSKWNADGAPSVKTEAGFTFDDNGLHISRDGNGVANQLDHTGMNVSRYGQTVLSATEKGVTGVNMHVKTHLIIGDGSGRSRIEDYRSDRTACFWIGG